MIPGGPRAWYIDLPTYAEVKHDFPDFGFDKLDVDATAYPHITARMSELNTMFYARYCQRMIGFETLQLWQLKLQNRFDEIASKYERAFRLYTTNATKMDKAVDGWTEHSYSSGQAQNSGSASSDGSSKSIDTPDSAINENDAYADTLTKDHTYTSSSDTSSNSASLDKDHTVTGEKAVDSVNKNIDAYGNYEQRFVAEFENLFNGVLC